jgi:hypothetical protein
LGASFHTLTRFYDFFSTSDCRDLLFHVQEHRLTIPQIKEFLTAQNLRFIGFEVPDTVNQAYRSRFPGDAAMTDLDLWNRLELEQPAAFEGMYQFWCQPDARL